MCGLAAGRCTRSGPLARTRVDADRLDAAGNFADEALATALHVALALEQPLLLEGEPGTGKPVALPRPG